MNPMVIDEGKAVITHDVWIEMFTGGFLGLRGGLIFHATDMEGQYRADRNPLKVLLDMSREEGVEPFKEFYGKFSVCIPPELHPRSVAPARRSGMSLYPWVEKSWKGYTAQ